VAHRIDSLKISSAMADAESSPPSGIPRRAFLSNIAALGAGLTVATDLLAKPAAKSTVATAAADSGYTPPGAVEVTLKINGATRALKLEPRTTLLDALRESLGLSGTKKGCDHGACGACTVHIDGRRIVSCLTLAIGCQGREITTIEGLADGEKLHPVQAAFIECDGFQCGFCTSGQIMSAVACIKEGHAGNEGEIREWMSGNLCRCGAYPNIVDAVVLAASKGGKAG
jgi:xanthine dehydrogenase YagT iron-sulfur-binding subunit